MCYWYHLIGIPSITASISFVIVSFKKENEKIKRIKELKNLSNSKIEALGNYENKSNQRQVPKLIKKQNDF